MTDPKRDVVVRELPPGFTLNLTKTEPRPSTVTLQHDNHRSHVHLRGVYGDNGENEGVLSVSAVLDANENYPTSGLISVGSPKASPLIDGYIPDLGFFSTSIEGAERLVSVLQDAIRDVRAGLAAASIPRTCDHVFCDANGNRVYLYCQRGCGTRDPLERLAELRQMADNWKTSDNEVTLARAVPELLDRIAALESVAGLNRDFLLRICSQATHGDRFRQVVASCAGDCIKCEAERMLAASPQPTGSILGWVR